MTTDQFHKLTRFVLAALLLSGARVPAHPSADGQAPGRAANSAVAAREEFAEAQKLLAQGLLESAHAAALKGLKADSRSVAGYDLLGIIDSERKDFVGATEAFGAALKLNSHDHLANYNLGVLLMARGRAAQAIPFFLRVRPPDEATRLNLVRAYLRAGQKPKALELARSVSKQAGNQVRVHFPLGVLLADEKQYSAAVRELEIADALAPRSFEILHNLGEAYLRTGQTEKAAATLAEALGLRSDSVGTMVLLGEAYMARGKKLEALEVLTRARQLAPRNTDVIFLMARLSMIESFYEDAIPLLDEGVKIDPQRPDLHAALGESYFTVGKVDMALREFKTLIRLDPSAASFAFLGLYYRHLGRFEEAKKVLNQGLKKDPRNAACLYNLGFIENKEGNPGQAEKYLQQALAANPNYDDALYELASVKMAQKRYDEAVPLLRRCVKVTTRPAEAYYKLATAERALHQLAAGERDIKIFQTLSKDPSSGPYPYQHFFESLRERTELPEREKTESDLPDLLQETQRHPDRPKTLYLLAETYLRLGRIAEAKRAVAQLDRASGGDARTAVGTGVLLARYRLYREAIDHFQSALAADPSSDDARFDLAETYSRLGDSQCALETLQQLSPRAAADEAVQALRGELYSRQGRTSEAVAIFEGVVARNPDNDQGWLSLALTQMRAGALEAAGESLRRGLARIPNSAKLHWGQGVLAVLEGDNVLAEQHLRKAAELMPEWQTSLSSLGVLYYQMGQIDKAREMLRESRALNPRSGLDLERIEQALAASPDASNGRGRVADLSPEARQQFFQTALALADQTP